MLLGCDINAIILSQFAVADGIWVADQPADVDLIGSWRVLAETTQTDNDIVAQPVYTVPLTQEIQSHAVSQRPQLFCERLSKMKVTPQMGFILARTGNLDRNAEHLRQPGPQH